MIASRQPSEINELVTRYEQDHKRTEASYLDLIIKSGGLLSYKEIMEMPVNSLSLFVERLNEYNKERNEEMKQAQAQAKARRR